jgi:hypothetical protein
MLTLRAFLSEEVISPLPNWCASTLNRRIPEQSEIASILFSWGRDH